MDTKASGSKCHARQDIYMDGLKELFCKVLTNYKEKSGNFT